MGVKTVSSKCISFVTLFDSTDFSSISFWTSDSGETSCTSRSISIFSLSESSCLTSNFLFISSWSGNSGSASRFCWIPCWIESSESSDSTCTSNFSFISSSISSDDDRPSACCWISCWTDDSRLISKFSLSSIICSIVESRSASCFSSFSFWTEISTSSFSCIPSWFCWNEHSASASCFSLVSLWSEDSGSTIFSPSTDASLTCIFGCDSSSDLCSHTWESCSEQSELGPKSTIVTDVFFFLCFGTCSWTSFIPCVPVTASLLNLESLLSFTPFTFLSSSLRDSLLLKSIELLGITFSVDVSGSLSNSLAGKELTLFPFFFLGSFCFFLYFVTHLFFGLCFLEPGCCFFLPDFFVFCCADCFATSFNTIFSFPLKKRDM